MRVVRARNPQRGDMRLGGDQVGRRGIAVLAATGVAGVLLAVHGWAGRGSGATPSLAAGSSPAPQASASSGRPAGGAATGSPAPATSPPAARKAGPLLRSEPYAK